MQKLLSVVFPLGDEYSLAVESLSNPKKWFTSGYSNYFNVYPEFFVSFTNFVRPTANIIYKIFSCFESPYRSQLIVINYGVHAFISSLIYYISLKCKNTNYYSFQLAALAFFTPAFWYTQMTYLPSFALDGIAALLCILSIIAFSRKNVMIGSLLLLIAIFTKETALPIAAAVIIFSILKRDLAIFTASSLVLSMWFLVRWFAFGGVSSGTYVFNEISMIMVMFRLSSLVTLPIAYASISDLKALILNGQLTLSLLYFASNTLVLGLLFYYLLIKEKVITLSIFKGFSFPNSLRARPLFTLSSMCLLFSILFYVGIGGSARFSYIAFSFLLLTLCIPTKFSRARNIAIFIMLITTVLGFFKNFKHVSTVSDIDQYKYSQAKSLINVLKKANYANDVFIVNDFISGYSRQENVAKYAGANVTLIRGSSININSCAVDDLQKILTNVNKHGVDIIIKVSLPSCANFVFEGVSTNKILTNLNKNILYRNENIQYVFKKIVIKKSKVSKQPYIEDYGREIQIKIKNKSVIYFNFSNKTWVYES